MVGKLLSCSTRAYLGTTLSRVNIRMTYRVAAVSRNRVHRTLVPLLAVVFMIAWGLLTTLVVLQDRMIDEQSSLIHTMFRASLSRKVTSARLDNHAARKRSARSLVAEDQTPLASVSPDKTTSAQVPLTQVPKSENTSQSPSSQVKPKATDKSGRNTRKARSPFSAPPVEITDPSDKRRVSISI